jgi:hypothetical protein
MQFVARPVSLSLTMMKLHVHERAGCARQIAVNIRECLGKGRSLRIVQ